MAFSRLLAVFPPPVPTIQDPSKIMEKLEDKHSVSDLSLEKKDHDGVQVTDDAIMAKEVEEFEERLQNDEAADEEYLVEEAYEVAIKVCCANLSFALAHMLSLVRCCPPTTILNFSPSPSGLSSLASASRPSEREYFSNSPCAYTRFQHHLPGYWPKYTTSNPKRCLSLSCSSSYCPTGLAGRWQCCYRLVASSIGSTLDHSTVSSSSKQSSNYTPCLTASSVKEHAAIIIMASSAAVSATAIQVISVQDCEYVDAWVQY